MTEPRHFHSARKGSGSLRPFPIYPLYTQAEILSLDKPIADCFLFRPRRNRKSAGNAVIPTFPTHWSHGLQHLRHKRPTFAFTGESGYTLGFAQRNRTQRPTRRNRGRFGWGVVSPPSERSAHSRTSPGRVPERRILPLLGLDRVCSQRTQRAFGTAMRLCVSMSRGVAAPLGCVIPWLFLSPHRRVSRFCSAASLARRKLSACSLVTAVRFLNRCSRRSMRGTCPSEQRSGCQF